MDTGPEFLDPLFAMMGEDIWGALSQSNVNVELIDYSVCALGDRFYFNFCGAAKNVDVRMSELGANRVVNRQDCDRTIFFAQTNRPK